MPGTAIVPAGIPRSWLAALGVAALAIYGVLTPPVPGDGDSAEFTIVLARAALAHPTGYPIYTLAGHVFCAGLHALGTSSELAAAWWSAVGGALAVFFFAALSDRLIGDRPGLDRRTRFLIVLAPTIVFALNPMVSFEATHAEVYSWHLAWVLGAGVLFTDFARVLREGPGAARLARFTIAWGLVAGAGMAHHTTAILFAAPMSAVLLWRLLRLRPLRLWPIAACLASAMLPLLSYGFVFWRAAHPSGADWVLFVPTFDGVVDHIRASSYRIWVFGGFSPSEIQSDFLARWVYPWLIPSVLMLAVAALAGTRPRERAAAWTLLAGALANLAFAWRLRVADPTSYFLAPLAVGLVGCAPVAAMVAGRWRPKVALVLTAAALAIGASWFATGIDRKKAMLDAEARIRRMWASIPPGPGIVFWNNDMYHRLRLLQILDGEKPGLGVWYAAGLGAPISRERFRKLHGVDPLEGLPGPAIDSSPVDYFAQIHRNVNRQTAIPVYEFAPERESVRLLRKPAPADSR